MNQWISFAAVCVCLLTAEAALAEANESPATESPPAGHTSLTATTHLFSPAFGVYYLEVNTRLYDRLALLTSTSYFSLERRAWQLRTGKLGVGASYHPFGDAPRGLYLEGYTELLFVSSHHEPSRSTAPLALGTSGNVLLGYRFVWDLGLVLDIGFGLVGLRFPPATISDGDARVHNGAHTRLYPNPKLNAGWSF